MLDFLVKKTFSGICVNSIIGIKHNFLGCSKEEELGCNIAAFGSRKTDITDTKTIQFK